MSLFLTIETIAENDRAADDISTASSTASVAANTAVANIIVDVITVMQIIAAIFNLIILHQRKGNLISVTSSK